MTKSSANLTNLLLFVNTLNFEDIRLQFNTIETDQSIASLLFTHKNLIRKLSSNSEDDAPEETDYKLHYSAVNPGLAVKDI